MIASFRILIGFFMATSLLFTGAIVAAVLGYGNKLVMVWMIVGPFHFWALVLVMTFYLLVVSSTVAKRGLDAMIFTAISVTQGSFLMLNWKQETDYTVISFVIVGSVLLGTWTSSNPASVRAGWAAITAATVAWFVDVSMLNIFAVSFALSIAVAKYVQIARE